MIKQEFPHLPGSLLRPGFHQRPRLAGQRFVALLAQGGNWHNNLLMKPLIYNVFPANSVADNSREIAGFGADEVRVGP